MDEDYSIHAGFLPDHGPGAIRVRAQVGHIVDELCSGVSDAVDGKYKKTCCQKLSEEFHDDDLTIQRQHENARLFVNIYYFFVALSAITSIKLDKVEPDAQPHEAPYKSLAMSLKETPMSVVYPLTPTVPSIHAGSEEIGCDLELPAFG